MKKSWLQKGSEFTQVEGEFDVVSKVKPGIYNITRDLQGWHLEKFQEKFEFPYKIYGLEIDFINYILKTFKETTGNLGILMNGTKGAGKTVCAKILANKMELPVIIIKTWGEANQSMIEYLGSFNFDCVLFFDEFEKQFEEKDSTVLQIMDGVYNNTESRKIFLLTTNEMRINQNLISRPSRIRYVKSFNNLSQDLVKEYLNDNLEDKSCIENLLAYVDTLEVSTIDILKAVVQEVNIHGFEEFSRAKSWFNVTVEDFSYSVWRGYISQEDINEKLIKSGCKSLTQLFERELKIRINPPKNPTTEPDFMEKPEEERTKLTQEYYSKIRKYFDSMSRSTVYSDKRFNNFKVGDIWDDDEVILVDLKKNIIATRDQDDYVYYYKVMNPNQSPSLFGNPGGRYYDVPLELGYGYYL